MTVQLPAAGIVIPLKFNAVAPPATRLFGVVPAHVPVTAPPTALIFVSASVNEAPVSALGLVLPSVKVTVLVPPEVIVVGLNALAIVGAAKTVRLAVLLAGPA